MVRVDVSVQDRSVFIDDKACRHRQLPCIAAIEALEIDSEAHVNLPQIFRQLPDQVELPGDAIVLIV